MAIMFRTIDPQKLEEDDWGIVIGFIVIRVAEEWDEAMRRRQIEQMGDYVKQNEDVSQDQRTVFVCWGSQS